jgi:hypothetical protein
MEIVKSMFFIKPAKNNYTIKVPDDYINKNIEILLFLIDSPENGIAVKSNIASGIGKKRELLSSKGTDPGFKK